MQTSSGQIGVGEATQQQGLSILEQQKALEIATKAYIEVLLKERNELIAKTEARIDSIANELKALGWKKPRKSPERKAKVNGAAK